MQCVKGTLPHFNQTQKEINEMVNITYYQKSFNSLKKFTSLLFVYSAKCKNTMYDHKSREYRNQVNL